MLSKTEHGGELIIEKVVNARNRNDKFVELMG
jgi:hypothetical protein